MVSDLNESKLGLAEPRVERHYEQHPYGKVWQPFDDRLFESFTRNIGKRGLDLPCLLYQGMILDGWHRYLSCLKEGREPTFEQFEGNDLEAAERVLASGLRRRVSADQRCAAYYLLIDNCPELNAKFELQKEEGIQNKTAGKRLPIGGKRVNVAKAKADVIGVGKSTVAKIEQLKKLKPEALKDIASGRISANEVLKEIGKSKSPKASQGSKSTGNPKEAKPESQRPVANDAMENGFYRYHSFCAEFNAKVARLVEMANIIKSQIVALPNERSWDKGREILRGLPEMYDEAFPVDDDLAESK
jgi:hypothetical protein